MKPASGRLDGDAVFVDDPKEANRVHNKSGAGDTDSANRLRLSLVEAAHETAMGRLAVEGMDVPGILAAGPPSTEVRYLAYRDLRARGLLVRHDGPVDIVWPRGKGRADEPWFRLLVLGERDPITAADLLDAPGMLAVVDEDAIVTYYATAAIEPVGLVPEASLPRVKGRAMDDRVMVPEAEGLDAEALGTPHGDERFLSLMEAAHLARRGVLDVDVDLEAHAAARHHRFDRTFPVYQALRRAGVVAKSGFRFGTDLRAYEGLPDEGHALWLIQAAARDDVLTWSDLSRAVRLAHGVRKTFLVAVTDPVRFISLAWFRP